MTALQAITKCLGNLFQLGICFFILTMAAIFCFHSGTGGATVIGRNTAIAKEATARIFGAFESAQEAHRITSQTSARDLIPSINYVAVDTSNATFTTHHTPSWWDQLLITLKFEAEKQKGEPLQPCSSHLPCLKFHNGGIVQYDPHQTFGKINSTHAIVFNMDPDGPGPEGRISFYQYADGHLTTGETAIPNTITAPSALTVQKKDPDYLHFWD